MKHVVVLLLLLSLVAPSVHAGAFEFSGQAVAGAPGTTTAPVLVLAFRGDGETTDTQIDLLFDTSRFGAQVTPRNGALCIPIATGLRVISPGSAVPLPAGPVRYCEMRFAIAPATAQGSYDLAADPATTECFSLKGQVFPCTAPNGSGVIRVGPNTPAAGFDYLPDVGSTLVLNGGVGEIIADYLPGGFGAAIELHDCLIAAMPGGDFALPLYAPLPLGFASNVSGSGLLALACVPQIQETTATLSCSETRNGTQTSPVSWNLVCPALPSDFMFADGFE
jgi:hypothetical protein